MLKSFPRSSTFIIIFLLKDSLARNSRSTSSNVSRCYTASRGEHVTALEISSHSRRLWLCYGRDCPDARCVGVVSVLFAMLGRLRFSSLALSYLDRVRAPDRKILLTFSHPAVVRRRRRGRRGGRKDVPRSGRSQSYRRATRSARRTTTTNLSTSKLGEFASRHFASHNRSNAQSTQTPTGSWCHSVFPFWKGRSYRRPRHPATLRPVTSAKHVRYFPGLFSHSPLPARNSFSRRGCRRRGLRSLATSPRERTRRLHFNCLRAAKRLPLVKPFATDDSCKISASKACFLSACVS